MVLTTVHRNVLVAVYVLATWVSLGMYHALDEPLWFWIGFVLSLPLSLPFFVGVQPLDMLLGTFGLSAESRDTIGGFLFALIAPVQAAILVFLVRQRAGHIVAN